MNEPAKFNSVVSLLWAIADLLNGAFKNSELQKIILPFTVLRSLDYALGVAGQGHRQMGDRDRCLAASPDGH